MKKIVVFSAVFILCSAWAAAETEVKKIMASDRFTDAAFGTSVTVFGDTAAVGAPEADYDSSTYNSGAVYLFERHGSEWREVQRIEPEFRYVEDRFGTSAAVWKDYIIVGSHKHRMDADEENKKSDAGAAYIFKKDSEGIWNLLKKLVAPDRDMGDKFGISVSIHENFAVVGAPGHYYDADGENPRIDAGAVYIFEKDKGGGDNWGFVQKLVASDRESNDSMGTSVSIFADTVVAGAPGCKVASDHDAGAAYVFRKGADTEEWTEIKKLTASDSMFNSLFGTSVSLSEDYTVVGAIDHDLEKAFDAGAAYVFKRSLGGADNWGEVKRLSASDAGGHDAFGVSVSLSGDTVVAGAFQEDRDTADQNPMVKSGAAYVFKMDLGGADNWGQVGKITAPVRAEYDIFGISVATDNGYVVCGASGTDDEGATVQEGSDVGAAYIFQVSGIDEMPDTGEISDEPDGFTDDDQAVKASGCSCSVVL